MKNVAKFMSELHEMRAFNPQSFEKAC